MALPTPLIVLLKGNMTLTVVGALSETQASVTYSDATNYRNELPASYIGRAWNDSNTSASASPEWVEDDRATATSPINLQKTRSMMLWWDGAAGTGNIVGKCWQDQFIGYGTSADFID